MTTCECGRWKRDESHYPGETGWWDSKPVGGFVCHLRYPEAYCQDCNCRLNDSTVTKMVPAPTADVSVEAWLRSPGFHGVPDERQVNVLDTYAAWRDQQEGRQNGQHL